MLSRTVTWTLSCALLLLASTAIADRIPGNQPEADHSNYGDMHKAKE